MRCTVLAGKLGNYCLNCFNNLEKRKKEKVRKKANQLKFWAKSGYYLFIILMAIAVFSFSLMALNKVFFIVGLIVVIIDGLYGGCSTSFYPNLDKKTFTVTKHVSLKRKNINKCKIYYIEIRLY